MSQMGLYSKINENTIKANANTLKKSFENEKKRLDEYKLTLTENIWKASSKKTFITGIEKIQTDVYEKIENKLDSLIVVCERITDYKTAESDYKKAQEELEKCEAIIASKDSTNQELIKEAIGNKSNYINQMKQYEAIMDNCETEIKQICGG